MHMCGHSVTYICTSHTLHLFSIQTLNHGKGTLKGEVADHYCTFFQFCTPSFVIVQLLLGQLFSSHFQVSCEDERTAELLRLQDSSNIKLALRVLGLMCDGQYRLMQNYLREQPDNIHNINIVGEVAMFLQMLLENMTHICFFIRCGKKMD